MPCTTLIRSRDFPAPLNQKFEEIFGRPTLRITEAMVQGHPSFPWLQTRMGKRDAERLRLNILYRPAVTEAECLKEWFNVWESRCKYK